LLERATELLRIVFCHIAHPPGLRDAALLSCNCNGCEKVVEKIGQLFRFGPVHVVEMHDHDCVGWCEFVCLSRERDEILACDLSCFRIAKSKRAFRIAPSIPGRWRGGETIAVVTDI